MDNWFVKNNIAEKLRVAIEDLRVGGGLPAVFRGLENGVCTVDVVYNGESVTFVNKMPEQKPMVVEAPQVAEIVVGDVGEAEVTESPEPEIANCVGVDKYTGANPSDCVSQGGHCPTFTQEELDEMVQPKRRRNKK